MEMYSFIVLEARSLTLMVLGGSCFLCHCLSLSLKGLVESLPWHLLDSGVPWFIHVSLQSLLLISHGVLPSFVCVPVVFLFSSHMDIKDP
jgi:hypothetical protein